MTERRDWRAIIDHARQLVSEYPYLITLRQLHYPLVDAAVSGYVDVEPCYKRLSALTAAGRREGTLPSLLDQTREIHRASSWTRPRDALHDLAEQYRRDRTEGQSNLVVIGGEKSTLLAQLQQWFDDFGCPFVLLRGYGSQTYLDDVAEMVHDDGRPAVLLYAGDFDPSTDSISTDLIIAGAPVRFMASRVLEVGWKGRSR